MDELLSSLQTIDWMGLCALGFGLAAGFGRGFLQQFSRFSVCVAALLLCRPLAASLGWSAEGIGLGWPQDEAGRVTAEVIMYLLLLPTLFFVRKLLGFVFGGGQCDFRSRLVGALFGGLSASVLFTGLASSWGHLFDESLNETEFVLRPVCTTTAASMQILPDDLQARFVNWPQLEESKVE